MNLYKVHSLVAVAVPGEGWEGEGGLQGGKGGESG